MKIAKNIEMTSSQNGEQKRKITKTEKIAELQGKMKLLTAENERLRSGPNGNLSLGLDRDSTHNSTSISQEERAKLKEALRALKRVTVKQEVSLASLREKSKQRRYEIVQKNQIIKEMEQENKALLKAHQNMKKNDNDDVSALRSQLVDLELKLAKEENCKAEQSKKLKESEAGISSLQSMLVGRGLRRDGSCNSNALCSVMSDSTSGEDVAKLKKELAKKVEKITNLQYELELYKDEIHDLKERSQFSNPFPSTPAPGELDFFEDDDDFFENF